jgi:5-methylcytosine-specific restriction endonuclease McrA
MENYVMNENEQILYDREGMYKFDEWSNELDLLNCSGEHEWEYRYFIGDSGRVSLYSQCSSCGKRHGGGSSLKHNLVPDLKEKIQLKQINKFDTKLLNKNGATWEKYNAYRTLKDGENKEIEKAYRREFYTEYIKSDKWKAIRLKVLKRDNNLCQACLETPAQDVHHITYNNIGDELMYELLSVCRDCHFNRIHKEKR